MNRETINATLTILRQHFPAAFTEPKPLKVGICEDLLQHHETMALSRKRIRVAVRFWINQFPYKQALTTPSAQRIDLEGNPVESVAADHRKHAVLKIKELQALFKQHKLKNPKKPGFARPAAMTSSRERQLTTIQTRKRRLMSRDNDRDDKPAITARAKAKTGLILKLRRTTPKS